MKSVLIIRSLSNLHSQKSRSMKSVRIPWYQKPIVHNNKYMNVQRGAMLAALFSFVSTVTLERKLTPNNTFNLSFYYSAYQFLPFSLPLSIYTVCQWQLPDQLIMDIISFHMSSFMLEIVMVRGLHKIICSCIYTS